MSDSKANPTVLVIGAMKCASSSLRRGLGQHPEICFLDGSDPSFFSDESQWQRGWSWYHGLFDPSAARVIGEGSNSYSMQAQYPCCARRIAESLPAVKLIYIVRDPLTRIESTWIQVRSHGGENVHHNFNRSVLSDTDHLIDPTDYWKQINAYRDYFSDDQILILFTEDLKADPMAFFYRCFIFLDVDPDFVVEGADERINRSKGKFITRPLLSKLRTVPGYRVMPKLLPRRLRAAIRQKMFLKRMVDRPAWHSDTRRWALDQLRESSLMLLRHCGKPETFWNLQDR